MRVTVLAGMLVVAAGTHAIASAPAWGETVVGEGVIRADERVTIRTAWPGVVRRIPVREGDVIRRGQVLVEVDNDIAKALVIGAEAETRRAAAAVVEAQRTLEGAIREYERNERVPDLITARELDVSRDAVKKGDAALATRGEELAKAEAELGVARARLRDTTVEAPFDGIVGRVYARVGDTLKEGETPVLDLLSLDSLYVEVALPVAYADRIRRGMPGRLEVESETPGLRIRTAGRVAFVYPELDPTIRAVRVKVAIDQRDPRVLPGMFAKVRLDVPAKKTGQ
jgi:RND family efflux transporter MFP subunit